VHCGARPCWIAAAGVEGHTRSQGCGSPAANVEYVADGNALRSRAIQRRRSDLLHGSDSVEYDYDQNRVRICGRVFGRWLESKGGERSRSAAPVWRIVGEIREVSGVAAPGTLEERFRRVLPGRDGDGRTPIATSGARDGRTDGQVEQSKRADGDLLVWRGERYSGSEQQRSGGRRRCSGCCGSGDSQLCAVEDS